MLEYQCASKEETWKTKSGLVKDAEKGPQKVWNVNNQFSLPRSMKKKVNSEKPHLLLKKTDYKLNVTELSSKDQ